VSTYFVTGATGSTGRRLVAELLRRPACEWVFALLRPQSADEPDRHAEPAPVPGDLTSPVDADRVDHVLRLAAGYDSTTHRAGNVGGTRRVVEHTGRTGCGVLRHVSSNAVAGEYRGTVTEDDFDVGRHLPSPHATEKIVREPGSPRRVHRPGAAVGDSRAGEVGRRHFFSFAVAAPARLPRRLPLVAPHFGPTNPVPVDHVVRAPDAFSRVAAGGTEADGVTFTSVRMPMVRTPKTVVLRVTR